MSEQVEPKLPSKEEITEMAKQDEEASIKKEILNTEIEIPKGLREEAQGETLYAFMISQLKTNNGYPYIGASRIENYDREGKKNSVITEQLKLWFKLHGGKDDEEFIKTYSNPNLVIIQLFAECPTMAADGMYDQINIEGKRIKTIPCGVRFLAEGEEFKPTLIMLTGACAKKDVGNPGTLGMLHGDPYHKLTAAEFNAVVQATMGNGQKTPVSDGQPS